MLKTVRTVMFALAIAVGGSVLLGGTAQAGVGGHVEVWQSAVTGCGTPFTPNWWMCISTGGVNASNTCVNGPGGSCTATTNKGGSATNNCVNFNGSCTATVRR
jgi:hypothetical protein